jgi:transcription termination factor Rho
MSDEQQPKSPHHPTESSPPQNSAAESSAPQQNGGDGGNQQAGGRGRYFDRPRRGGNRNPRGRRPARNNRYDDRGVRGPNDQAGQTGSGDQSNQGPGPDEFSPSAGGAGAPGEAPAQDGPPPEPTYAEGVVELSDKGFGLLREAKRSYAATQNDIFITPDVIRQHNLRDGVLIKGETRRGPRGIQLFRATEIEGDAPEKFVNIPLFEELTTISPNKRIRLETVPERFTTRVIDLMTPIGKGQRGLIVAPPRTGKTTLLQHIAAAVVKNHPEMKLIILLVDERPEEVTEIRRTIPQAELYASSNDSDLRSHTRIAQIAIDRAKRLVEQGKDVFVLMDSLTRIGRAFNNAMGGGGRTMSGGMDSRAMEIPRKLFAAARNTEEAGSLTIMATALIETNSRMDDLIFQEFKGTGNMEIVLDRKISDQRIYPAIDIFLSGTRREELLLPPEDMHKVNIIRRGLAGHKPIEAIERLLFFIRRYPTNAELLKNIPG